MHTGIQNSSPRLTGSGDFPRPDEKLVQAAQAGSSEAFEQLQSLYTRRLFRQILAITRNREDAEDALQDTFLRAFVALRSFEGRCHIYTWLSRIAINSALMELRKRRSRAEVSLDCHEEAEEHSPIFELRDTALNPEQICDQRQQRLNVVDAIRRLDPTLRSAIGIWITEDCSLNKIAQTLDISLSAAKTRLHRARRRLSRLSVLKEGRTLQPRILRHQKNGLAC